MAEKAKILIIEDEKKFTKALVLRLEANSYDVDVAHEGMEGLRKAREGNPDLIILDVMLPKINGYKIARLLKYDEKYKHVPIIMATARSDIKDQKIGKETGADIFMTKPFKSSELMENITKLLKSEEVT